MQEKNWALLCISSSSSLSTSRPPHTWHLPCLPSAGSGCVTTLPRNNVFNASLVRNYASMSFLHCHKASLTSQPSFLYPAPLLSILCLSVNHGWNWPHDVSLRSCLLLYHFSQPPSSPLPPLDTYPLSKPQGKATSLSLSPVAPTVWQFSSLGSSGLLGLSVCAVLEAPVLSPVTEGNTTSSPLWPPTHRH